MKKFITKIINIHWLFRTVHIRFKCCIVIFYKITHICYLLSYSHVDITCHIDITCHPSTKKNYHQYIDSAPKRLQKMLLRLQHYSLDVKHQKGISMAMSDLMS